MDSPEIAIAVEGGGWPPAAALKALAERAVAAAAAALDENGRPLPEAGAALSILFTDDAAMRSLNARWRGKDKPTNVLSFPAAPGARRGGGEPALLGDVALAAETVAREAAEAQLRLEDHVAHLIIHGFFHLLGYDHEVESQAEDMEALERAALSRIGIADPYARAC